MLLLSRRFSVILCLSALLLSACSVRPPKGVLSQSKMEDVLYDYHLAQSLAQQTSTDSLAHYTLRYRQAVYEKYGIDEATFQRSMEWYARHTDKLSKIYDRLAERYGEQQAGGPRVNAAGNKVGASADTANLWQGPQFVLLSSQASNRYTFTLPADTALHEGDLLQWRFFAEWFYHEGSRDAQAVLVVRYANDSVSVASQKLYGSGQQTVSLTVGRRQVVSIEGMLYQATEWTARPRMLVMALPQLLRMHRKSLSETPSPAEAATPAVAPEATSDTLRRLHLTPQQRIRDSLLREDARNRRPRH